MPRFEPLDWYETPLYYDIVFDADTPTEAGFLEAVHARHGRAGGRRVLEPACGTGRLVAALAARGWRVTGFDLSEGSLRFCRARLRGAGLRARVLAADMASFELPGPFDLAHCLVSTFKLLGDEASARAHLERVAASLAPGGLYVLGLHLTDYADRRRSRERWVAARDGVEVTCTIQAWPASRRARTERIRSRLVAREAGAERRYETEWTFRTYGVGQLRALLRSVPALEHVATYGFDHDVRRPVRLDGRRLDVVLVLRRRDASEPVRNRRARRAAAPAP